MLRLFTSEKKSEDLDYTQLYLDYKKKRLAEALVADCPLDKHYSSVFSFYGRYYKLSARPKIAGAHKMILGLAGTYVPLTHDEWKAVTTGRVGKITSALREANKLHPEFLKQEEAFNSHGKIHYHRPG